MKLLATAFFLILGQTFAQTVDTTTANFAFNQSSVAVTLEQKEFETVYRTDQVPSTCFRSEVQGSRTECHTEYDRSCHTSYQEECRDRSFPVCQTVPRRSCSNREVCTTQSDSVCNSQGCTSVPRRVCHTENQCTTTNDSVCHNESRRECQTVPRESCQNIPRQACQQLPNVVQVPYACTKPVQVPVGQELKLDTKAVVNLSLSNFAEVGALTDQFTAQLADGNVTFSLVAPSTAYLYQIVSQNRTEAMISATEKQVTYTIVLQATSIEKLNSFLSFEITNPKLFFDRLEFGFSGAMNVPFKGHLKLLQYRGRRRSYVIVDDDFKSNAVVNQGATSVLRFNTFGAGPLEAATHGVTLSLGLDLDALKKDILNPDALNLIHNQGQPLTSESDLFPNN